MAERYPALVRKLGHTYWFPRLGRALVPVDRFLQRTSKGRLTVLGSQVLPQLLLTSYGRQTGQPRTVALLYARHGDDYLVVASNWGQQQHPSWSANLLAEPKARIEVDGRKTAVTARLTEGAERQECWAAVTKVWPAYDTYEARSRRTLRVFTLEPTRR
jgi:deazaflavin-dependent oxidoreductase (nitroreductase family)